MTRRKTKIRRRKAAYYAATIAPSRLWHIRYLLDTFIRSKRIESVYIHVASLYAGESSFNKLLYPHARNLLKGRILSPDDLIGGLAPNTSYLQVIPRDILNCIKYYLFVPFTIENMLYARTGISYCGVKIGVERVYPRRSTISGIFCTDTSYREVILVDGTVHAHVHYVEGVVRERIIFDADGMITHVYVYSTDDKVISTTPFTTIYSFMLTVYYPSGTVTETQYRHGKSCGIEIHHGAA